MPDRSYKRHLQRHPLHSVIEVHDYNRACYVGRLANIHQKGFMLLDASEVETDHLYQLELLVRSPRNAYETIRMGADCLWKRHVDETHWAGFQILDISQSADKNLQEVIANFCA